MVIVANFMSDGRLYYPLMNGCLMSPWESGGDIFYKFRIFRVLYTNSSYEFRLSRVFDSVGVQLYRRDLLFCPLSFSGGGIITSIVQSGVNSGMRLSVGNVSDFILLPVGLCYGMRLMVMDGCCGGSDRLFSSLGDSHPLWGRLSLFTTGMCLVLCGRVLVDGY